MTPLAPLRHTDLRAYVLGARTPERTALVEAHLAAGVGRFATVLSAADGVSYFLMNGDLYRQVGTGLPPNGLVRLVDTDVTAFWLLTTGAVLDLHGDHSLHVLDFTDGYHNVTLQGNIQKVAVRPDNTVLTLDGAGNFYVNYWLSWPHTADFVLTRDGSAWRLDTTAAGGFLYWQNPPGAPMNLDDWSHWKTEWGGVTSMNYLPDQDIMTWVAENRVYIRPRDQW